MEWPEPNRPGFVAFHCDYRDGSVGRPEDEAYFDLPKIEEYMRRVLTAPDNYLGVIDQFDVTLQFTANADGTVRVEIPDPKAKGSMTRNASLDECIAWVRSAGPSLKKVNILGLTFELWE